MCRYLMGVVFTTLGSYAPYVIMTTSIRYLYITKNIIWGNYYMNEHLIHETSWKGKIVYYQLLITQEPREKILIHQTNIIPTSVALGWEFSYHKNPLLLKDWNYLVEKHHTATLNSLNELWHVLVVDTMIRTCNIVHYYCYRWVPYITRY